MTKCESFIKFFDELIEETNATMPEDVEEFYEILKSSAKDQQDKPAFTEMGLIILDYLKNCEQTSLKARDIAEGVTLPSRKVSGAMRKLVTDGYVEKFGQNPVIYTLTEKGKNFNLNEMNKEN